MYTCIKFQFIIRFWDQICAKNMNNNDYGKINIKFEIRIKQSTPVPHFSEFGELQYLRPSLPKKDFKVEY